ncbi:MAG TPA: hypothetical protein VIH59_31730 [Candidatus Tectomicrobia bacterium]|jgi:hypothetical protein
MTRNTFDQFNDLMARLMAADGTVAEELAHELLDSELAREVLAAIVGGRNLASEDNPYEQGGMDRFRGRYTLRLGVADHLLD